MASSEVSIDEDEANEAETAIGAQARAAVERFLVDSDLTVFGEDGTLSVPTTLEPLRGSEAIERWLATFRNGIPDLSITITQLVAEGHAAAVEFTFSGNNLGWYMGMEPNGNFVQLPLAGFFDVKGDRIVGGRLYYDQGELARQMVGSG